MKKRFAAFTMTLFLALSLAVPALAQGMSKPREQALVASGETHTAAIDANGALWTWGWNSHGQLGNGGGGNAEYYDRPVQTAPVKVLDSAAAVSCGGYCTAVIKTDGTLWIWGRNDIGQLGNGGGGNSVGFGLPIQTVPVKVMENVAAVSLGTGHAAAVKTDGSLWTWGWNSDGQLGNGGGGNSSSNSVPVQTVPVKVMENVAAVSLGGVFTAAINTDGSLWMWGGNEFGQLGSGGGGNAYSLDNAVIQTTPVKVLDSVAAVSCGSSFTAAIKTDGSLWMWGRNDAGQLGLGRTSLEGELLPVKVMDHAASVSCGNWHTAVIKTDGTLWAWGNNEFNQLGFSGGNAETDYGGPIQTVPVKVLDGAVSVNCSWYHTVAVKTGGTLWSWGDNDYGVLGNGTTEGSASPIKVMDNAALPGAFAVPSTQTAYASTQNVLVDGRTVEFPCYALKDANGNDTNYVKLRDVAQVLNGTAAQFEVTWDGAVNIVTGQSYTANGTEMNTPFSGSRTYTVPTSETKVNGQAANLDAIVLTDDAGNGYTYYKLRDLGAALGFSVDWSADKGIFIETDKPKT